MCGIAGSVQRGRLPDIKVLRRQLATMEHRGPDAYGHFGTGPALVGQTRLAVIDVSGGDPPVTNEDRTLGVVFNGEIYNFRSLRTELQERGHRFRTSSDTEVIVHLAEEKDAQSLVRTLDGMFAFGLWNSIDQELILARDRLGKKPLFYWSDDSTFVFASEIKALLLHPMVRKDLDEGAILPYLIHGYVPTPDTFFAGVRSLPPATVLTVDAHLDVDEQTYWVTPLNRGGEAFDGRGGEGAREVIRLLDQAVRKRLVADVPLGAFLSGGVDSSAVVALMSSAAVGRAKTFSIGFEGAREFDETEHARLVARTFGTDHTEFVVKPDALDLVERLVWHHDQPFGDSSAIPTFILSQLTRQHVTVALSGDGGDELFGGYERFRAALAFRHAARLPLPLRKMIARGTAALPRHLSAGGAAKIRRFLEPPADDPLEAYLWWVAYTPPDLAAELAGKAAAPVSEVYRDVWQESEGAHLLDRLRHLNIRTYLLDDLLVKTDRMSMAHGLEVRSPFLDTELLSFAMTLPPRMLIKGLRGKKVLREALSDIVPKSILQRPKHGFGVPLERWFREDLQDFLRGALLVKEARVRRYLQPDVIDRIFHEHVSGRVDRSHVLWTLLTLELFLRKNDW